MSDYGTPTISGGWEPRRRLQLPAEFPTDEDVEIATADVDAGMVERRMMDLGEQFLMELKELLADATPEPWVATHRHVDCTQFDDERAGLGLEIEGPEEPILRGQFAKSADARLVAMAPMLARMVLDLTTEED